jgi:thiamine biosynthesis lipoprotein
VTPARGEDAKAAEDDGADARAEIGANRGAEFGVEFVAMACGCEVRLLAPDQAQARALAQPALDEVRRIEAKYSRYLDDSVTARINTASGAWVAVDAETAALLDFAGALWRDSGGRFDLTSGVLRRAWDFKSRRVPTTDALAELLPLVGWDKVEIERTQLGARLRCTVPGMEIDFGGIGKEYAADRAATLLRETGLRHGFVNLGGDVRAFGAQADGAPWRIGIQHPRQREVLLGSVEVAEGAVATSGDYERYFETDGRRYCHILDPRTGWPATHWQSVAVAATACVAAGACTTVAMLMPVDEALAFLRAQGVQFLAVSSDGQLFQA